MRNLNVFLSGAPHAGAARLLVSRSQPALYAKTSIYEPLATPKVVSALESGVSDLLPQLQELLGTICATLAKVHSELHSK